MADHLEQLNLDGLQALSRDVRAEIMRRYEARRETCEHPESQWAVVAVERPPNPYQGCGYCLLPRTAWDEAHVPKCSQCDAPMYDERCYCQGPRKNTRCGKCGEPTVGFEPCPRCDPAPARLRAWLHRLFS